MKKKAALGILLCCALVAGVVCNALLAPPAVAVYSGDVVPTDYACAGYQQSGEVAEVLDLTDFGVTANDQADDTAALQAAIDSLQGKASPEKRYVLLLPAGEVIISDEIHIDVSGITLKGRGSDPLTGTKINFKPAGDVVYPSNWDDGGEQEPEIDGKMWPGNSAFRVETRIKHPQEQSYEGSINFHWKTGVKMADSGAFKGDTVLPLYKNTAGNFTVGMSVLVRSANTEEFFAEAYVPTEYQNFDEHMRTQMFKVTDVDILNNTITIDKPLEFDMPFANKTGYNSKVVPLTVITDVGFEDFYFTQTLDHTKYAGKVNPDEYDAAKNPGGVKNRYENAAYEYAIHGILFRYASNCYVNNVQMYMTGSHPIVTEFASNLTISDNIIDGSWNKGKGGHGYVRLSKLNDSIVENNIIRNVRHLAIQWASSGNIIRGNDLTCDINLHGGWERNNYILNNVSHIVYEHRSWEGGKPEDSTWYPVFWSSAPQASKWAGPSGYNNVLFGNEFYKQETPGGEMKRWDRYSGTNKIFHMGWDGTKWKHLMKDGEILQLWSNCENLDYSDGNGVYTETFASPSGMSLSARDITVEAGKTLDLKLLAESGEIYEPLVEWQSGDESVATAVSGRVNGIAPGKTVVTASYPGSSEKCTCTVTVIPSSSSEIPAVAISDTVLNLEVKQKAVLQILANGKPVPYTEVTWSSSAWFVQIDKYGIITPNSKGTVTITGVYQGQSYTCTVNVYPVGEVPTTEPEEETTTAAPTTTLPPEPPKDLVFESISGSFSGVQQAGTSLKFTCKVSGGSGGYRFVYYIVKNGRVYYETPSGVTATEFNYTPQEQGVYTVLAYCYDGYGKCVSKTCDVTVGGSN